MYTLNDGMMDMKEANFLPNVSLNVLFVSKPSPVVIEETADDFDMDDVDNSDIEDEFVSDR